MEEHWEEKEETAGAPHRQEDSTVHVHADGTVHSHADGTVHAHGDEHDHEEEHLHGHTHTHSHTQTKAVISRLARAIGHLEAVKKMVENGRDCSEVLVQLAAVRAALGSISKVILKDHMEHCIADAVRDGDESAIEELEKAIDQLLV